MDIHSHERDFFVSYRTADESWAEWIAWQLEATGYSVFLQKWDFRPGENWVHQMQQGASSCRRTIAVLTPAYFDSNFTRAEWYNAFARDPTGEAGLLLPVRVKPCDITGLLGQIIYIDLVGLETEQAQRERLLAGVERARAKPLQPPPRPDIFPDRDHRDVRAIAPLPPPSAKDRRELCILLDRVEQFWVKGVLEQSVQHEALINLGKETKAGAVQNPWEQVLEMPDTASRTLPADMSITQVFEDVGRLLLILGEPGSGKTMTLLELARDLIGSAWNDPAQPVPVVFHLSSWKEETKTLFAWLTEELRTKYLIPERVGCSWLDDNRLLPLLDGLDEVQAERRAACIRAINAFLEEHGTQGMAVCSRLQEYTAAPVRLKMRGAICLQPLTLRQVNHYLAHFGSELGALRTALQKDQPLQDLAQSPLMLSVMTLAYQAAPLEALAGDANKTFEARRARIFETYVARMLARKGSAGSPYPQEQTKRWLSWLGQNMQRHGQTIFLIEQMQPTWLPTRASRWQYALIDRLGWGIGGGGLVGILGGLAAGNVRFGLILGLIVALVAGLFGGVDDMPSGTRWSNWRSAYSAGLGALALGGIIGVITGLAFGREVGVLFGAVAGLIGGFSGWLTGRPAIQPRCIAVVETMRWSWRKALQSSLTGMLVGLGAGLSVGFVIYFSIDPKIFDEITTDLTAKLGSGAARVLLFDLIIILFVSLMVGVVVLAYGALFGLVGGLVGDEVEVEAKLRPNQGIWRSARWAILLGGSITLIFGLVTGVIVARLGIEANIALFFGLLVGLSFGVAGGLAYGGYACLSHLALRFVLWRTGSLPWHFGRFLDYCSERIFLRKVGGGYIFVHRLLLEYFTKLDPSRKLNSAPPSIIAGSPSTGTPMKKKLV